jgi:Xaa-Pro dipeptidase
MAQTDTPTQGQPVTELDILSGREAAFAAGEFERRQELALERVRQAGHEALIITSPENIYWLTGRQTAGYFAFQALVLSEAVPPFLLVRQLEMAGSLANTWLSDIHAYQDADDPAAVLAGLLKQSGISRPALSRDGWFVSAGFLDRLEAAIGMGRLPDGSGLIEGLRAVKSESELDAIRLAASYAEAGLRAGIDACAPGSNENAVAAAMLSAAVTAGSETMAMEPLVSSGPRSGLPHMTWRRRVLETGDPIFLELAGSHARYHSALMRSVWLGNPPAEAQAMMDCAERALDAALSTMRPGVSCAAVHDAAQAIIDAGGYHDAFRKRIGYSMGIAFAPDWGEGAILSLFSNVDRVLEPGMVFHLPATLRRYGHWTVGASETVIVTKSGIDILSSLPRSLTVR